MANVACLGCKKAINGLLFWGSQPPPSCAWGGVWRWKKQTPQLFYPENRNVRDQVHKNPGKYFMITIKKYVERKCNKGGGTYTAVKYAQSINTIQPKQMLHHNINMMIMNFKICKMITKSECNLDLQIFRKGSAGFFLICTNLWGWSPFCPKRPNYFAPVPRAHPLGHEKKSSTGNPGGGAEKNVLRKLGPKKLGFSSSSDHMGIGNKEWWNCWG